MSDHRLPYHLDSWIALAMLVVAVLITVMMNGAPARTRTLGTLLAAAACLVSVVWFLLVLQTGIMVAPEGPGLPTDGLKPGLLWTIATLSLGGGLFLIWATMRQHRRTDRLALADANSPDIYGRVSRHLHWTTAVLFIALIPMGVFMSMIPDEVEWRVGYYVVHKTLGLLVLLLVLVRIVWHFISPRPSLDPSLQTWEKVLAKTVHYILYFLMLALPITGFVMSTYGGKASNFFFWDLPLLWEKDLKAIRLYGLLHKMVLPYCFYLIFCAHLLGALKHHFLDGQHHNIRRMIS